MSFNSRAIRTFFFIVPFLFIPLLAEGQSETKWWIGNTVTDIQFENLEHVDKNELKTVTEQFIGKKYSDSLFMDLHSKLYALNYFKKLQASPHPVPNEKNISPSERTEVIIRFEVVERSIIDTIEIEGNESVRDGDILDSIMLKRDEILTKNKLSADEAAIRDLYLEKGYPDVAVSSSSEEDEESNTVSVTFTIDEGRQTRVRTIDFASAAEDKESLQFSDKTLGRELETKEQSLFHSGVFKENRIEKDKEALKSYYQKRGYIDAEVVEVNREVVEQTENKNFIAVTFYIKESQQWTFGGVAFEGNKLFDDQTLRSKIELEKGDVLDLTLFNKGYRSITDLYYNDGYIYNRITREMERDSQNRTVSFLITIQEKGRAHIENIIVKGTEKTKDRVVYREIPLETGDVFSKKQVIEGMRNLYNTGLFSNVTPETPMGSTEGLMDLVYNVEEAKTTTINFGLTFTGQAGDFPVLGFLRWTDNNFRGLGEEFSVSTELSGTQQNLNFSYQTDWFLKKRMNLGVEFSLSHTKVEDVKQDVEFPRYTEEDAETAPDPYEAGEEYESIPEAYLMDYDEWELSLGLNTGYTFHTNLGRVGLSTGLRSGLGYIQYDDDIYRPYNPTTRENHERWRFNNRWWNRLSWDTRDYIFSPSKGFYLSERLTYGGGLLGGVSHYIKSKTKAEFYQTLIDAPVSENWNFKTVFAFNSALSYMFPQLYRENSEWNKDIKANTSYMLYTDGMNTDRGWDRRYDGEAMLDNRLELRIPIAEQVLWSDIFFHSTGFWEDRANLGKVMEEGSRNGYRFSYGAGIRFTIPNLPLGIYMTRLFKYNENGIDYQGGPIFSKSGDSTSGWRLVLTINIDLM